MRWRERQRRPECEEEREVRLEMDKTRSQEMRTVVERQVRLLVSMSRIILANLYMKQSLCFMRKFAKGCEKSGIAYSIPFTVRACECAGRLCVFVDCCNLERQGGLTVLWWDPSWN